MHNPAPLTAAEILKPEWLSEALSIRYPGTVVRGVEVVKVLGPVATKIRFKLDYAQAPADAPRALCAKGILDTKMPKLLESGTSERETRFYMEVAPKITVRVPALAYGGVDPVTGHGLLINEDLYAAGASFLGALSPRSIDQAKDTIDQLARLHAPFWDGKGLDAFPWIVPDLPKVAAHPFLTEEAQQALFDDPRGEKLPKEVLSAKRLHAGLKRLAEHAAKYPPCLCHGDFHAGNLYIDAEGRPGVLDWQIIQRANWALDVAYHLGTVLTIEDRRRGEQDLLRYYLDRLATHGGQPPSWEEAWLQYRVHMVYGYFQWAVTRWVTPPQIIYEFVHRLGTAVLDLDSYGLLGV